MRLRKPLLAVLISFFIPLLLNGQVLQKGTIKMEISDVKTDNTDLQQMVSAMKGTMIHIQFADKKQQVSLEMMGGLMKTNTYVDLHTKSSESYMDMMGQKIKMVIGAEDMETQADATKQMLGEEGITYDRTQTKEILGYPCYKASGEIKTNGQTIKLVFWITDMIKVPQTYVQNLQALELKGTPLETHADMGMMEMTYVATEVEKTLKDDFFKRPDGDYKEMTLEELKQMGMSGQMGF